MRPPGFDVSPSYSSFRATFEDAKLSPLIAALLVAILTAEFVGFVFRGRIALAPRSPCFALTIAP